MASVHQHNLAATHSAPCSPQKKTILRLTSGELQHLIGESKLEMNE